jgi:site-specific DNA recombinase
MKDVVIYRRQSLDKSGDELGIERQLKECKRVAKARGLSVGEVITDNSVSASKRGRPGYTRLVQMMASGQVSTVIILRIDRLLRLNDELEELIQLVEQNPVKVITVEGDVDLSTPQGRLVARILVSVARSEMEVKSARHKLANQQRAEAGKPHGSRRCFGYEKDGMTIREDEALVLKDIADRFLSGWSYRRLAEYLNGCGIRTSEGKQFFPITVCNMLQRKRYAAIREYKGVDYSGAWPAIYDADTWARIQYTVKQRKEEAGNRPVARKYLLTGLVYCGACGGPLNGETKRDAPHKPLRATYHCRECHEVTRGAVPLDHFIKESVIYRLDVPDLSRLLGRDIDVPSNALLERKAAQEAKLRDLLDDYTDGTLTKAEYVRAKARAQAALDATDQALTALFSLRRSTACWAQERASGRGGSLKTAAGVGNWLVC